MKFPSEEFDDTLTACCHGTISQDQWSTIERLLAEDPLARDEYLWQVELHARLASSGGFLRGLDQPNDPISAEEIIVKTRPPRPSGHPAWLMIASFFCVVAYLIYVASGFFSRGGPQVATKDNRQTVEGPAPGNGTNDAEQGASSQKGLASAAGLIRSNVRFAWAQDAPIIVGTGPLEPLPLGAFVPYDQPCYTLNVWNWSEGTKSRVHKDIRLLESQRLAVSPDGKLLVTSDGKLIELNTGKIDRIDLGPEFFSNQGDQLRRIQDLAFTPDGSRLALLTTQVELGQSTHPLLQREPIFHPEVLMLKFPQGQLLSRFPPGHSSANRFAFSADGNRIFLATPADGLKQQIVERKTDTGEVVRTYEPSVEGHAYALAVAPNGERLAVFDGEKTLHIWDTRTGKRLHRMESVRHESYSTALKYSRDSRYIAVNAVTKSFVVDGETGKVLATLPQSNAAHFLWSDDGMRLTTVTGYSHYEGGPESLYNMFPAVFEWNWKEAKLLRSFDSAPPARKGDRGPSQR